MCRLKFVGERIASRDSDRQAAEIHTRVALMDRFSALGRAEIMRAGETEGERGSSVSYQRQKTLTRVVSYPALL